MFSSNISQETTIRIINDLSKILSCPIPGFSLCFPDKNNPFLLKGNFEIVAAAYRGLHTHFKIQIPFDYPMSIPTVKISMGRSSFSPNFELNSIAKNISYEEMIGSNLTKLFETYLNVIAGSQEKFYVLKREREYTISFILMQLQGFFSNPDLPKAMLFSADGGINSQNKNDQFQHEEFAEDTTIASINYSDNSNNTSILYNFTESNSREDPGFRSPVYSPLNQENIQNFSTPSFARTSQCEALQTHIPNPMQIEYQQENSFNTNLSERSNNFSNIIQGGFNYKSSTNNPNKPKSPYRFPVVQKENQPPNLNMNFYSQKNSKGKITPQRFQNQTQLSNNNFICSETGVNAFDPTKPIIGYPINLIKDKYGRIQATPITEMLSYDAFMLNFPPNSNIEDFEQYNFKSKSGETYNFWLPLYINDDHFSRSKQLLLNAIRAVYNYVSGAKKTEFDPLMTLKVLPSILIKNVIHILDRQIHHKTAAIDIYCQTYRLFIELVKTYPILKKAIDAEVEKFCLDDKNRHKKVSGDLGEFIIKLTLSVKDFLNPRVINLVLKESLARQISWALKKDESLMSIEAGDQFLQRFMSATRISHQLLLVLIETAKLLLNSNVKAELEQSFGLLSENRMKAFQGRLAWVQKNIDSDWEVFVQETGQETYIPDAETMFEYICAAYTAAQAKNYIE